ncbi:hypothetical protein [Leptotrichia sp. oral taxon 498]|nr:hypothetical protein [Leptotrichia sp. oral taxon 498]
MKRFLAPIQRITIEIIQLIVLFVNMSQVHCAEICRVLQKYVS